MGHHTNDEGQFKSDKYPYLDADKIILSFRDPATHAALAALAQNYSWIEPELADDIRARLKTVHKHPGFSKKLLQNAMKTADIMKEKMG